MVQMAARLLCVLDLAVQGVHIPSYWDLYLWPLLKQTLSFLRLALL